VGDSGEQDLELYTEIALNYRGQVLGIFIRDVTTPLLSTTPITNTSTGSLPLFFESNGQPIPRKDRGLATLKGLRDSWRQKSSESAPTLSTLTPKIRKEELLSEAKELNQFTAPKEIGLLTPPLVTAQSAGEGVVEDLPLGLSMTPPLLPRPVLSGRTPSSSSIGSTNSEPATPDTVTVPPCTTRPETIHRTGMEDSSSRVKRVENWRRRLVRAREKLLLANCEVGIWTWRVGGDVEQICECLVMEYLESKKRTEYNGVNEDIQVQKSELHMS
jgi:hypothetical protein